MKYLNKIIQGDCLKVMKQMEENSVDTIITDPPYALGFMGKAWDKFPSDVGPKKPFANQSKEQKLGGKPYQDWMANWAEEALRVIKPGGTLLIFGGTRTYHRLACAIEDAGWILKDCIMWLYGSGFPKATDISKQLDKKAGKERELIKEVIAPKPGTHGGSGKYGHGKHRDITLPTTPEAKLWNGWKSHGLKPAYEPILVAMKPNEGSYANNALKHGVAGLNIDGGRIEHNEPEKHTKRKSDGKPDHINPSGWKEVNRTPNRLASPEPKGRFPANIILDREAAKILDEQSGELHKRGNITQKKFKGGSYNVDFGQGKGYNECGKSYDSGGASRFFKVIK